MSKIRIGIAGYGNLGRGVELAVAQNDDMELVGVFTRRDPSTVSTITGVKAYTMDDAVKMAGDIDVMIICGGSATDLPKQTPELAALSPRYIARESAGHPQDCSAQRPYAGWIPGKRTLPFPSGK